jgi:hypothetical protein
MWFARQRDPAGELACRCVSQDEYHAALATLQRGVEARQR